ncbi:sensor histidine kinase [Actinomadura kijaniata]|uniref:sensor histidine kinase n=1 Tax=Actinomadura kijaniata TaxID=46161 RepID=UPI001FDFC785|nr:sensor histidine kinase [Actinomadura kijaniata]
MSSSTVPSEARARALAGGPRGLVGRAFSRAPAPVQRLSRWSWTADAMLALALAVSALQGALGQGDGPGPVLPAHQADPSGPHPPPPPALPAPGIEIPPVDGAVHPWQILLALLVALPLVVRRRYPLAAFVVVVGAALLYDGAPGLDLAFVFTGCVIAAYSAAVYSPYRTPATGCVMVGGALVIADHKASLPAIGTGFSTSLSLLLVFLAANALHSWRQRMRSLEARQEAATRLAVERERSRIAQELHDVVTHNVSMMVVQTGAARKVMAAAPDRAEQALLAVESGGRAALTELRHVMGLLTMNGDDPDRLTEDLAPPPGLEQVEALAARVRATGVPVELSVTGASGPLPPGIDLAVYRVVQEALTNTVKHAAGASVTVTIDHGPRALRLEVTDTGGRPDPSTRTGTGRGLIGMRERLAVYGGTLEAGPLPDGGYRIRAVVPLEDLR